MCFTRYTHYFGLIVIIGSYADTPDTAQHAPRSLNKETRTNTPYTTQYAPCLHLRRHMLTRPTRRSMLLATRTVRRPLFWSTTRSYECPIFRDLPIPHAQCADHYFGRLHVHTIAQYLGTCHNHFAQYANHYFGRLHIHTHAHYFGTCYPIFRVFT